MKPGSNLDALTGLRFFAASWVVYYHAHLLRDEAPWALERIGHIGFTAVPLFFVLSGFVLTWNYADAFDEGRAHVGRYLLARAARVMPLFLFALGWTLTYLWPHIPAPRPLLSIALGLNAWQPSWAWLANVPSWSVSNELFFYALFPFLVVLVPGGRSWLATTRGLFVLMGAAYVVSFVPWMASRAQGIHDSFFLGFWPPFHLPEFVVGMALGRLALREARDGREPRDGTPLVAVALAGYALVAFVFVDLPHALLQAGLLVPLHGLLVYGLARGGSAARPFAHPWIVRVGELGYAIYLLQEPVQTTLRLWVWDFHQETGWALLAGNVLHYVVLLAVSAVAYHVVERPARERIRSAGPTASRALGVTWALLLGYAVTWSLVERISDDWGPAIVVMGDFSEEIGCRTDWDPACGATRLRRVPNARPSELLYEGSFRMPAGSWHAEVAYDEAFVQDRAPATAQITLATETEVRWRYSHRTGRLVQVTGPIVTVPGSYQRHAGCPRDWMPDCLATELLDLEGDGLLRREIGLPAGHYEVKVAVGLGWDENYGRDGVPGGENVVFDVPEPGGRARFNYDPETHRLTVRTER